jgi:hypothetical protein
MHGLVTSFQEQVYETKHREPTSPLEEVLKRIAWANSVQGMDIVLDGWHMLRDAGLLEVAFLDAWSGQKFGFPNWTNAFLEFVFGNLEREKLLNASDPMPPGDSFIVYRGVAGVGRKRRVRGYSWSGDIGIARLFAEIRASRGGGLPEPAVFSAVIQRQHVLAYINESGRNEQEFLLLPRYLSKIKRIERVTTPGGGSGFCNSVENPEQNQRCVNAQEPGRA